VPLPVRLPRNKEGTAEICWSPTRADGDRWSVWWDRVVREHDARHFRSREDPAIQSNSHRSNDLVIHLWTGMEPCDPQPRHVDEPNQRCPWRKTAWPRSAPDLSGNGETAALTEHLAIRRQNTRSPGRRGDGCPNTLALAAVWSAELGLSSSFGRVVGGALVRIWPTREDSHTEVNGSGLGRPGCGRDQRRPIRHTGP
jgi:hypothetical protein